MSKSLVVTKLMVNRLPEITTTLRPRVSAVVRKVAADISTRAQNSMTGEKSGRIYLRPRNTKAVAAKRTAKRKLAASDYIAHQASAPGEAPAIDTGTLKGSIRVEMEPRDLVAIVGTDVEYAPHLEFGTSRMAPRPYLGPAAEAVRPSFEAAMRALFS